ncbi:MAG: mobile mystery protein B [Candidatus Dadabacteria bacterium]|nr:mobile mystery protein B [Candidatus Dadabacteria bacterium]
MNLKYFNIPKDSTFIDPEEAQNLLLVHVRTRTELNKWEYKNITEAVQWLDNTRPKNILNEEFIRNLHKRMFNKVWKNAGIYRSSGTNIGVPWWQISTYIKNLCEDVKFWIKNKTYDPDEIGARFHQKLVFIHPFINGNGRHSRLMTDLLMENLLGCKRFSWGGGNLGRKGEVRKKYIRALKQADKYQYNDLIDFVRS